MSMTHYMELLMQNAPWNLLLFMALPVVLAETIAITELVLLFSQQERPFVKGLNKICGILAGVVFLGIAGYLIPNAVIPLTQSGEWRTWIDVVAVATYLLAGIPMILIALLNLRVIFGQASERTRMGFHVANVAAFLVLSHIAMIAGMADPALAGYQPAPMAMDHGAMQMDHGSMNHDTMNHGDMAADGHMDHMKH